MLPERLRPYVPAKKGLELDPHNYKDYVVSSDDEKLVSEKAAARRPMTSACSSLLPQWRRKPPYCTLPTGLAHMRIAHSASCDARHWARAFGLDARLNVIRSHVHKCGPTCWKTQGCGGPKGTGQFLIHYGAGYAQQLLKYTY